MDFFIFFFLFHFLTILGLSLKGFCTGHEFIMFFTIFIKHFRLHFFATEHEDEHEHQASTVIHGA